MCGREGEGRGKQKLVLVFVIKGSVLKTWDKREHQVPIMSFWLERFPSSGTGICILELGTARSVG